MGEHMTIRLFAPGMTRLHKVGLAGLYMTLTALEEQHVEIPGLNWVLSKDRVQLEWMEDLPGPAFESLIQNSFLIDDEGFFRFPGLERIGVVSLAHKHLLYEALLNTFLQFGPHGKKGSPRVLTYDIDEKTSWIRDFRPIEVYKHQDVSRDFLTPKGKFRPAVKVVGWLYPGGVQRHAAHGNTVFEESTERAIALLYAPVGALYFRLRSRLRGRRARVALLLPEIPDLEAYADARDYFMQHGVAEFTGTGPADAALAFAAMEQDRARDLGEALGRSVSCQVVTFGTVAWNEKQKSRTQVRTLESDQVRGFSDYELARSIFRARWQVVGEKRGRDGAIVQPEYAFLSPYTMREIIAENVADGRRWFHDLARIVGDKTLRSALHYERREIGKMVQASIEAGSMSSGEVAFVRASHEAWRRRLGQLGARARRENISFSKLAQGEYDRLRMALTRCKNAEALRETVLGFWTRGGVIQDLQISWQEVWTQFSDAEWKKARDLALLALVSYQPASEEEDVALTEVAVSSTEEGNAG